MKRTPALYVAWLVAAVVLVFAVTGKHPYSFYTLLRWICCVVFVYSAFTAHEKNRVAWTWIFGALAVLYNPIFHVHLDRSTWVTVNWLTVAAISVATAFFWPRDKESTVSLSEDKVEILPVSRRTVAREWLIFLAVLPLGFATCFCLGFYREDPSSLSGAYDAFWNANFGLGRIPSLALWLAPYLTLTLIRSIIWSISTLWPGRSLKLRTFHLLVAVYFIGIVFIGLAVSQNIERQATEREAAKRALELELLNYVDLSRITLSGMGVMPASEVHGDSVYRCLYGISGTIRNDLSRSVQNVHLRASIYDELGKLIDFKEFRLQNPTLYPGVPVPFSENVVFHKVAKYNADVPINVQCFVNVVAADYVP
jgi:uncharacterized protein DUF6804